MKCQTIFVNRLQKSVEGCVGLAPVRMLEVVAAAVDRAKLTRSSFAILLTFKGIIHINSLPMQ